MAPAPGGVPFDPRRHAPLVRRALQRFGVGADALDDAVQDVFVVLVRRAADFDRSRSLVSWMWGVARGVASTHRRTRVRRGRLHEALTEQTTPSPGGADEAWARARATELVASFAAGLDPTLREVFVRSELHGESGPELAAGLGINLNTAYARVRTVRLRFEAELERREGVTARLRMFFAPLGWLAPKSIATATLGASLVITSARMVPAIEHVPAAIEATPASTTIAARTRDAAPREHAQPANDHGMKTAMLTTMALTATLVHTSPAEARDRKPKRATPVASDTDADDAARVEGSGQTTQYIFDGDDVEGMVLLPDGLPVDLRTRARFPSLLRIRGHFLPELVTMAKDV